MALNNEFDAPETQNGNPAGLSDDALSSSDSDSAGESGANPLLVATAVPLNVDLTVLGLDDLLGLRLEDQAGSGSDLVSPGGLARLLETADLPADLTTLDLEQVLGLKLAGSLLPTVLEVADLPADLTALELAQVLGLNLDGDNAPTIKEVVQLALQNFGSEDGDAGDAQTDEGDGDVVLSSAPSGGAESVSFTDDPALGEEAPANPSALANAAPQGLANGQGFAAGEPVEEDLEINEPAQGGSGPVGGGSGSGGSGGASVINGTGGDDVIAGTGGADTINGLAGNDTIDGLGGDDSIDGGDDNDVIDGQGGDDTLIGGAGSDVLNGGGGSDYLDGGLGSDDLNGGGGADTFVWDAADSNIDGGGNIDTLLINVALADITSFGGTISDIDRVDLGSGAGGNSLTASYADVLAMTDNADTLIIDGAMGDSIDVGNGWTDGGVSGGYHTYTQGSGPNTATIHVDVDVAVNANILL